MRSHVEVLDTKRVKWKIISKGVSLKILGMDNESGSDTVLVSMKKGVRTTLPEAHEATEEIFVISGRIRMTDWMRKGRSGREVTISKGCYIYRPKGSLHGPWEALEDTLTIETHDGRFTRIFNPDVWECSKCYDKLLWELPKCSNCGRKRASGSLRFKPVKGEGTTVVIPKR